MGFHFHNQVDYACYHIIIWQLYECINATVAIRTEPTTCLLPKVCDIVRCYPMAWTTRNYDYEHLSIYRSVMQGDGVFVTHCDCW